MKLRPASIVLATIAAVLPMAASAAAVREPFPTAAAPPPFDFAIGAATIRANCKAAIGRAQTKIDAILSDRRKTTTFASVVKPLEDAFADLNDETVVENLESAVSTDAKARAASFACQNDIGAFGNAIDANADLYAVVEAASQSGTATSRDDRKLTSLWLVAFKRAGADLPPAARKESVALSNEINALETTFAANLGNDTSKIHITTAQAAGLPDDFVAGLAKRSDGYDVPVNESTNAQFLHNASDPAARKAYYFAYNNRAPQNVKLLERAIAVRDRLAHIYGYPTWAAYVLADKMAQSPKRVTTFLAALDAKLLPRAKADLQTLAALKAKDLGTPAATIDPWDVGYYDTMLNKTQYAVDEHAIAQYFPVDHVERSVFDIYSKLLGVKFAKRPHAVVWYPDVTEWTVTDVATGRYIGDFYLDLYPRPGKYDHFASFTLMPNRVLADGRKRPPLDAIIGNWPKPAPGKPAVLSHQDVETFFHEFGHDMAAMLATAPYETLSEGFRADFIEAPSQMLENWVWDPEILKQLSSNVTTGEPLPDDTIAKLRASRYVDYAYFTTQQIVYASVDMKYHTSGPNVDTTAVWHDVQAKDFPLPLPAGVHPQAGFGHIMGGYDAGYYGYLWSKVYAQDMFTAFQAGGLESPIVGARYRNDILKPARALEPDTEVKNFLGRPMSPTAFYKEFDQEPTLTPTASATP